MREYATALDVEVPTCRNLADDVVRNGTEHPDDVVVRRRHGAPHDQQWVDVTAARLLEDVRAVARGLLAAGVGHGDRVLLLSRTRYEWTVVDYAVWYLGGVTVPLYDTSGPEQVRWALGHVAARVAVVETEGHLERLREAGDVDQAWALDEGGLETIRDLGTAVTDEDLERRRAEVDPDDVATVIPTSGTTGEPKGCALTHRHLDFEVAVALRHLPELFERQAEEPEEPTTLLVLPLAHVFARVVQVGSVRARVVLAHSPDVRLLLPDLAATRPTFVLAVPRIFELLFNNASQRALADGRGATFGRAAATAISWSRAREGGRVPLPLRARHRLFETLVYRELREVLGGRCRFAISGGAPLGERLGHFYRGIGVPVLEGYGLTETTAAVTVNTPADHKIGTVGRPLPGTAVRVADDGELRFRGGQVFDGYWHEEQATREMLDDHGWLRSGDLGEIDDEGFVRITGRKEELLVTAGGKNVSPGPLENLLTAHPLVDQALVVGDGQPYVAALVTLDPETVEAWAEREGVPGSLRDLAYEPRVRAEVQQAVDAANATVSQAESIRSFEVLPVTWTEEGGQLTPSLKLRRRVVLREHRDDVDALFAR